MFASATLRGADTLPVWQTDWNTAFRMAKEQHRLVLVDYVSNACKPCHDIETISFMQPEVMQRLSDFVLLRVDILRNAVPQAHREYNPPAFIIFDPDERERFRITDKNLGALYPRGWGWKETGNSEIFDRFRAAAPAFLHAAELFEAKQDLQASFLIANTYARLKLTAQARTAYAEAKRIAEQQRDHAAAQLAEVQSALTFAHDGDPAHSIAVLKGLVQTPAGRDNEAIIWLALGHAYEIAKDMQPARNAYEHAQSLAPHESRTYTEAGQAIARMQ